MIYFNYPNMKSHLYLYAAILLLSLTSCSMPEPAQEIQDEETLVVNIDVPKAYSFTRADQSHKLRYTARLYSSSAGMSVGITDNCFRAKTEMLASEGNTVVFRNVPSGSQYIVTVFADYIDASAAPDASGHYPDRYWDTSANSDAISAKVNPQTFFNNDNIDCFAAKTPVFTKSGNAYETDLTLQRIVSKVRVVTTGSTEALRDLTVTAYSYADSYSFEQKGTYAYKGETTSVTLTPSGTSGELFSFYVLGLSPNFRDKRNGLKALTFRLSPKTDYEFANPVVTIDKTSSGNSLFLPVANNIYKLQGDLLNTTREPSDEIRVNVSTDNTWTGENDVTL